MIVSITTLCHYVECYNVGRHVLFIVILNVVMLNVAMLNVDMLNTVMLNVFILSVIRLSVMVPRCDVCHNQTLIRPRKYLFLSSSLYRYLRQ
jgi:hypothetical protein